MLPLVDKPIIHYGVEECVNSGVDNIILVTGRGKNASEDHFDVSVELETFLEARGKTQQLDEVRKISNLINFAYVRQGEPLGLGHAVLVAEELVGDEPFAVILGDDVIDAPAGSCLMLPRGVPHTFAVEGERARTLVICTPGGFEGMFDAVPAPPDMAVAEKAFARFGIRVTGPHPRAGN